MHTNLAETRRDLKDAADDRNILLIKYSMKDEERLMGWEVCILTRRESVGESTVEHGAL